MSVQTTATDEKRPAKSGELVEACNDNSQGRNQTAFLFCWNFCQTKVGPNTAAPGSLPGLGRHILTFLFEQCEARSKRLPHIF